MDPIQLFWPTFVCQNLRAHVPIQAKTRSAKSVTSLSKSMINGMTSYGIIEIHRIARKTFLGTGRLKQDKTYKFL